MPASGPRTAWPPMIGDTAATGPSQASIAARIPGTARIGPIETNGLDGAMTTTRRRSQRLDDARRRAGGLRALVAHAAHRVGMPAAHEPALEVELAAVDLHEGPHGVVGGRQQANRDAERAAEVGGDGGERLAPPAADERGRGAARCRGRPE